MPKAVMRLNEEEQRWLDNRIDAIDVQFWCPNGCLPCGAGHSEIIGQRSMSWEKYDSLSEGILEIKQKNKQDLLVYDINKAIDPFYLSDPVFYHSADKNKEKTIYDVVKDLNNRHSKKVRLTTSGWKQGNTYMQRAIENIVSDSSLILDSITYSIKTVLGFAMADFDAFTKEHERYIDSKPGFEKSQKFITSSKYAARLIDNMKTLKALGRKVEYDIQYFGNDDLQNPIMRHKYGKYAQIFSKEYMMQLTTHAMKEAGLERKYYSTREFGGVGCALDLGIQANGTLKENRTHIESAREDIRDKFSVIISAAGKINIYYGEAGTLTRVYIPTEYFIALAENSRNSKKHDHYMMLAGLQGKSLLN